MTYKCLVCEGELRDLDLPKSPSAVKLAACTTCGQIVQFTANGVLLISSLLERVHMGDDRAMAAVSDPTPKTLPSFLDAIAVSDARIAYERGVLTGKLMGLFSQLQNRLQTAEARFAALEFVSESAVQGMKALREAIELVSTAPARNRGIPDPDGE